MSSIVMTEQEKHLTTQERHATNLPDVITPEVLYALEEHRDDARAAWQYANKVYLHAYAKKVQQDLEKMVFI